MVSASTAQTATVSTLAGYFSSIAPAKQVETDYLYDPNYQARNLTRVPTEVRIKDGSGNVKAKTHFYYDESSYQLSSSGTMPTAASGTWTDPTSELGSTIGSKRALPTTVRSYAFGRALIHTRLLNGKTGGGDLRLREQQRHLPRL